MKGDMVEYGVQTESMDQSEEEHGVKIVEMPVEVMAPQPY